MGTNTNATDKKPVAALRSDGDVLIETDVTIGVGSTTKDLSVTGNVAVGLTGSDGDASITVQTPDGSTSSLVFRSSSQADGAVFKYRDTGGSNDDDLVLTLGQSAGEFVIQANVLINGTIQNTSDGSLPSLELTVFSVDSEDSPLIKFERAQISPITVEAGDLLGRINCSGKDTNFNTITTTQIISKVEDDATIGASQIASELSIRVDDGSTVDTIERFKINSIGNIFIGIDKDFTSIDTSAKTLTIRRSGGGTNDIVQDTDIIGTLSFDGWDGNSFESTGTIKTKVNGTPSNGDIPADMLIESTSKSILTDNIRQPRETFLSPVSANITVSGFSDETQFIEITSSTAISNLIPGDFVFQKGFDEPANAALNDIFEVIEVTGTTYKIKFVTNNDTFSTGTSEKANVQSNDNSTFSRMYACTTLSDSILFKIMGTDRIKGSTGNPWEFIVKDETGNVISNGPIFVQNENVVIASFFDNGSTLTITTVTPHEYEDGQIVELSGFINAANANLNASFVISNASGVVFDIPDPTVGTTEAGFATLPIEGEIRSKITADFGKIEAYSIGEDIHYK